MFKQNNTYTKKLFAFRIIPILYIILFILISSALYISRERVFPRAYSNFTDSHFDTLQLNAKAVYVYDTKENRVIYEKNAHLPLPLASITKLISVHCSLKNLNVDHYVLVPDKVYSYNDRATSTGTSEVWSVKNLAIYTLLTSSNSGATTLAEYAGGEKTVVDCMNNEAQSMNLFETSFQNVTGLDIDENTPSSIGSAENVSTLFQSLYFADYDIVSKTALESYNIYSKDGTIHKAQNTNIVAGQITGFLGSKTGLTDTAGGNITFAMNVGINHIVFVTILGSGEMGRFEDALVLSKSILKSFAN